MPPAGFEPTISAGLRLQIYALDRAATGTGTNIIYQLKKSVWKNKSTSKRFITHEIQEKRRQEGNLKHKPRA